MKIKRLIAVTLLTFCLAPSFSFANGVYSANYIYERSSVYDVHCKVGYITTLNFSPNEELTYVGAGDSTRWVIDVTKSAHDGQAFVQLLVKPLRDGLNTNLIVNTNKRSYQINLASTTGNYHNFVEWTYFDERSSSDLSIDSIAINKPLDKLNKVNTQVRKQNSPPKLNRNYTINGKNSDWKPLQVFDDGEKTFILMPSSMKNTEAPALFAKRNKVLSLINYRVKDNYYIIDRLIDELEMRLGKQFVKIKKNINKETEVETLENQYQ